LPLLSDEASNKTLPGSADKTDAVVAAESASAAKPKKKKKKSAALSPPPPPPEHPDIIARRSKMHTRLPEHAATPVAAHASVSARVWDALSNRMEEDESGVQLGEDGERSKLAARKNLQKSASAAALSPSPSTSALPSVAAAVAPPPPPPNANTRIGATMTEDDFFLLRELAFQLMRNAAAVADISNAAADISTPASSSDSNHVNHNRHHQHPRVAEKSIGGYSISLLRFVSQNQPRLLALLLGPGIVLCISSLCVCISYVFIKSCPVFVAI
jgi:hypothetical protein